MATRHHIQIKIEKLLKLSDTRLKTIFDKPGDLLRKELKERQLAGEIYIGAEGCQGFDPVNGCPGHEI